MKRLMMSLLLFCLGIIFLYGQDFYLYENGQKRFYEVSATKMMVKSETLDVSGVRNAMQRTAAGAVVNVADL